MKMTIVTLVTSAISLFLLPTSTTAEITGDTNNPNLVAEIKKEEDRLE